MFWLLLGIVAASTLSAQEGTQVGERPYELEWAGRTEDHHPPLIDFEDLSGWTVETENSEATLERTREEQIWGTYVAKLTYHATGDNPVIRLIPPEPVTIQNPFDAVTLWVYGNNWFGGETWARRTNVPQAVIEAVFADAAGNEFSVRFPRVRWKYWFLCHRRLTPEQIESVTGGAQFLRFRITNGRNEEDLPLYLDNLVAFTEEFQPLEFDPRPRRGIEMFEGQGTGTNTGPGELPFPTREETILPENLTDEFETRLEVEDGAYVFTYAGSDGTLEYRLEPETGTWADISATWQGTGGTIRPCVDGGVYLAVEDRPALPEEAEHLGTAREGDVVISRWRVSTGDVTADVTYRYRLWNKSLVIDTIAPGGNVKEVSYGYATGLENPRLVTNPYYTCGGERPAVAVSGTADQPLFLTGNTDWYRSNASQVWAQNRVKDGQAWYNGGARYIHKTDGERNDCYERFFITLSPQYQEMLPTVANPVSQWKHITGTHVWRAHGAGNRERDKEHWQRVYRHGLRNVVVTDHETMWRDGGESFTFRTKAAPGKGGDEGAKDYARFMQDTLGFVYGPYNNFTDLATVNEYFEFDIVNRQPDKQLQHAWTRCYAPKPARAVEYCEMLAPKIEEKYHFSTAYCDVHTAVTPWSRTDYDARVPGAGTFAATFYPYGEIMLLQKKAWGGPVYSEGNNHFMYCGLTDGNYGQDQVYDIPNNPWLVDFDLRKLHDLCCNFGMGNPGMFYGRDYNFGRTREEVDASVDRFLAATVAFGHPGFLVFRGGYHNVLRSYYMLQQLHSSYTQSSADRIRYADAEGDLLDTSEAVASGAYTRNQVVTRYENGCMTVVNGNADERMKVSVYGRELDLPPNGYVGWTADGSVEVRSSDPDGHRCDYAAAPAYIYIDGRGRFTRFEKAAGNGIGICRTLEDGGWEVIPYEGGEVGFAIDAVDAVALNYDSKEIGPAEIRRSRGLTYVMPVEDAFSYILTAGEGAETALSCERDEVVAGEEVVVSGRQQHDLQIPGDAEPGDRIWRQFEGSWIDFTVVPLVYADLSLDGNVLEVALTSNLANQQQFRIATAGQDTEISLQPDVRTTVTFDLGEPEHEMARIMPVDIRSGQHTQQVDVGMVVEEGFVQVAELSDSWETGMALRGQEETSDFGDTRGYAAAGSHTCGGVKKDGFRVHPPYMGGVGYTFIQYDPVALPEQPEAAFRASVGKGDGSDPGDGILYRVAVVDEDGSETVAGETTVTEHEWRQIEADLAEWAGQTVQLKLVSDVGPDDNSTGDWACWADMRIETATQKLVRRLDKQVAAYRREPAPHPVQGLTVEQLRNATEGWLRYDGMGLSGTGEYATFATLNGIDLGNMAPAGGDERNGVWAEDVSVPLTREAIQTLDFRNQFTLRNPNEDWFKVRRFWIDLILADGTRCSSQISTAVHTQPPGWDYAEGIGVPHGEEITVSIWFAR